MAMLLVLGCKGRPAVEPGQAPGMDSTEVVSDDLLNDDSRDSAHFKGPYKEFGSFKFDDFEVSIQSFYYYEENHNDYWEANYIILRDLDEKVADTMMVGLEESSMENVKVTDVSDALKFKSIAVRVSYTSKPDIPTDEFFEFADGSLNNLCIPIEYLKKVWRIDEHSLGTVVQQRDDVLMLYFEYPATIDLDHGAVTHHIPDIQVIKRATTAKHPLTVYKKRGDTLSQPYEIKIGTPLLLDTFFHKAGVVRMVLPDSTPVFIMREELSPEQ